MEFRWLKSDDKDFRLQHRELKEGKWEEVPFFIESSQAMHSDGEGRCGHEDRTWFHKGKPCPKCG